MELKVNKYELPSNITFNFEELKQELEDKVGYYTELVYTDEQIKDAKSDKASMNKLKKALNDERIALEKEYMKPFNVFKGQVNEIIGIIDKPINAIDTQVKAYEDKCRIEKKKAIEDYFNSVNPYEWLTLDRIADVKWLNASFPMKNVQIAIDERLTMINSDLKMLAELPDYSGIAITAYKEMMNINSAIGEANKAAKYEKIKREKEAQEQTEDLPFTIPDFEENTEDESNCFIPKPMENVTFKALLSETDKIALMKWLKDRMIEFSIVNVEG